MADFCSNQTVDYHHRVDDAENWHFCLVPEGGVDAVLFAGLAVVVMAVSSPPWNALTSLVAGGVVQALAYYFNLGHLSNAINIWLAMRPADIFTFVFLPPFILYGALKADMFMLKKMALNVVVMSFIVVVATCLVLIPFMMYGLRLEDSGWKATDVALFGAAIGSTDGIAVTAALEAGGAPHTMAVLLDGESLFNDATSLTLFTIFKELVEHAESKPLAQQLDAIILTTIKYAAIGVAVGVAMGILTKGLFAWFQHRNQPPEMEIGFTVGAAYLTFYITQVGCGGSGAVGVVAYGMYGSATLLWGMSNKIRQSGAAQHAWEVITFLVNSLIFFFMGASSVNFAIRANDSLYTRSGEEVFATVQRLPAIYVFVFAVRGILLMLAFKLLELVRLGTSLSWKECLFLTVGGLRGALSLVLAQTISTLSITHNAELDAKEHRVKAEAAMYTSGFVIMTLLINGPLLVPLMTILQLNKLTKEKLLMRGHVKATFFRFSETALQELREEASGDAMLQGVDWVQVERASGFKKQLDKELPEESPCVRLWDVVAGWVTACWGGRAGRAEVSGPMRGSQGSKRPGQSREHAAEAPMGSNTWATGLDAEEAVPGAGGAPPLHSSSHPTRVYHSDTNALFSRGSGQDLEAVLVHREVMHGAEAGDNGAEPPMVAVPIQVPPLSSPLYLSGQQQGDAVQRPLARSSEAVLSTSLSHKERGVHVSSLEPGASLKQGDESQGTRVFEESSHTTAETKAELRLLQSSDRAEAVDQGSLGARFFAQESQVEQAGRESLAAVMAQVSEEPAQPSPTASQGGLEAKPSGTNALLTQPNILSDMYACMQVRPDEPPEELLIEYRLRLITGLESYFEARFSDGILSSKSYKMLWYVLNNARHMVDQGLPLWHLAYTELSSEKHFEYEMHQRIKKWIHAAKGSRSCFVRKVVGGVLRAPAWMLETHLGAVRLAGLEAAIELWVSLTSSLQTQWLQHEQNGGVVLEEVQANAEHAWKYILEQRIQEPYKFQAVQTYRASIHVLSRQLDFIKSMRHGGMIDERDAKHMQEAVSQRLQHVCNVGPVWRHYSTLVNALLFPLRWV